jgi:3D (Asp-Asp-Asp) domain-containing protein
MDVILAAAVIFVALLTPALASPPSAPIPRRPTIRYCIATAYSVEGTGASGKWSHPGTVAADRTVLPLNSRIRIYGAGRYSGDYTVEDTGGKVDGHHIDVYMPSQAEAKKFGRQRVRVVVLKYGDDEVSSPDPRQTAEARAADRRVRATPSIQSPRPPFLGKSGKTLRPMPERAGAPQAGYRRPAQAASRICPRACRLRARRIWRSFGPQNRVFI